MSLAVQDILVTQGEGLVSPFLVVLEGGKAATMKQDRPFRTLGKGEDMQHPALVWTDPAYADEPLRRLRTEYVEYLKGRAERTSPATIEKYAKSLVSFERSVEQAGEPCTLGNLTPYTVNRWVREQRERGLSEDGIASRLAALKVFTNRYIHKHLELTTVDLLRKVPRITPPEKPFQAITEADQEKLLGAYDRGTFEDIRNRAMMAVYLATGLRFSEVLNIRLDRFDRISGEIWVTGKGNRERGVRLSPNAMREVKTYLRKRPEGGEYLFVTEEGGHLSFWGGQSVFRELKKRSGLTHVHAHLLRHNFAQKALQKGAERGVVQDMLGHASPVMTNRYLGNARKAQAAKEMPRYSPF